MPVWTSSFIVNFLGDNPPREWRAVAEGLSDNDMLAAERAVSSLAVHVARFSAYLSKCIAGGTHEDAVKHQNVVARKVRKALGYAYDDNITF